MKHIEKHRVNSPDLKMIPEGELFCIREDRRAAGSKYVLTPHETETWFCLAVKIKGQVYESEWYSEKAARDAVMKAFRQVRFIKHGGWYATNETRLDDMRLFREPLFRCAYCANETTDVKGPCVCRRVAASLAR